MAPVKRGTVKNMDSLFKQLHLVFENQNEEALFQESLVCSWGISYRQTTFHKHSTNERLRD